MESPEKFWRMGRPVDVRKHRFRRMQIDDRDGA
jgi:hypothetical protein